MAEKDTFLIHLIFELLCAKLLEGVETYKVVIALQRNRYKSLRSKTHVSTTDRKGNYENFITLSYKLLEKLKKKLSSPITKTYWCRKISQDGLRQPVRINICVRFFNYMNTFFNVSTCKSRKKNASILSTDPGAPTFKQ